MENQRLELPSDVAQTIMGMLSPTERALAVLCVSRVDTGSRRMSGRLREGSVTDRERALLKLTSIRCIISAYYTHEYYND